MVGTSIDNKLSVTQIKVVEYQGKLFEYSMSLYGDVEAHTNPTKKRCYGEYFLQVDRADLNWWQKLFRSPECIETDKYLIFDGDHLLKRSRGIIYNQCKDSNIPIDSKELKSLCREVEKELLLKAKILVESGGIIRKLRKR